MSKRTEDFEKELQALLNKYNADLEVEDFGSGYSTDYKLVVDFNSYNTEDEKYVEYEQTVIGKGIYAYTKKL